MMRFLPFLAAIFMLIAPAAAQDSPPVETQIAESDELVFVRLQTSKGNIYLALNRTRAPVTVENFLAYVNAYYYDRLIFHRVVPGRLVQSGGYNKSLYQRAKREPIKNEADNGLKNLRGSIAMARHTQPDTARAEFFINLAHNEELDHKGKEYSLDWGYAVFGEVVHGMEVVDAIGAVEVGEGEVFDGEFPQETIMLERADEISRQELADAVMESLNE